MKTKSQITKNAAKPSVENKDTELIEERKAAAAALPLEAQAPVTTDILVNNEKNFKTEISQGEPSLDSQHEQQGGKKKASTKGKKGKTLLPLSNDALQSRIQSIQVCKAIAREIKKETANKESVTFGEATLPDSYLNEAKLFTNYNDAEKLLEIEGKNYQKIEAISWHSPHSLRHNS